MAKIRITVEYDLEEGMQDGETYEQALNREALDWQEGNVGLPDILGCMPDPTMSIRYELIP